MKIGNDQFSALKINRSINVTFYFHVLKSTENLIHIFNTKFYIINSKINGMELAVYPYDFEYRVEGDKIYVYSYAKLADGSKIIIRQQHQVFFYASLENILMERFKERLNQLIVEQKSLPAKVLWFEPVELELKGRIKSFLKIYVNYPKAVPALAKEVQSWGLECFEKDILFIHRYLRDKSITPMTALICLQLLQLNHRG